MRPPVAGLDDDVSADLILRALLTVQSLQWLQLAVAIATFCPPHNSHASGFTEPYPTFHLLFTGFECKLEVEVDSAP